MKSMTTHERVSRMYAHQEADRVPITDGPWGSTIERWHREGLPKDVHYADYFGMDKFAGIGADNSPRYPSEVVEDTEEYTIHKTNWGATLKSWRHAGGVPEFLDFRVTDEKSWLEAKERMQPTPDRIDWKNLEENHAIWRAEGCWINLGFWFGFDVTHSWFIGTERVLMGMVENPEWIRDVFEHELDLQIALFEMVIDKGYDFDAIGWPDDLGFKNNLFFSIQMYRDILKPVHKRACDWAHERGLKVHLHSCGDVRRLVPEFIEIGVDMLNPLEVKAGVDPVVLKEQYGDKLALHGGLNAVSFGDMDVMEAEMRAVVPRLKENGGYILSSDHSVPDSVSLQDFQRFMDLARELGSYS